MFDEIKILTDYGPLGILASISLWVAWYLYRDLKKLRDEIQCILQEHAKEIKTIQDEKLEMILKIQSEVNELTTRLTSIMETFVTALTKDK